MLKSIKLLLDSLEEHNILYCHWKSNEHLLEALDGDTDLDVLFDPIQRVELEQVLDSCGLKRFRSTPLMQYNAIEDFIGFDKETARVWHLHTHYRMTLGEKHLKGYTVNPWTHLILDNRRMDEQGIYCSACEDELVLLLVRMAMKLRWRDIGKKIGNDDRVEMKWLVEHTHRDDVYKRAVVFVGEKAASEMNRLLSENSLTKKGQLRKLHNILLKELSFYTGFTWLGSRWMRHKREYFWGIGAIKRKLGINSNVPYRRVSPNGGNVIAFLGCDGAGKSCLILE